MRETMVKKGNRKRLEFDDAGEFVGYCRGVEGSKDSYVINKKVPLDFSGGATWEQAVEMSSHGWKAGTAGVTAKLDELKCQSEEKQVGYQWDVTGDLFDVGTMLTGVPEHWLEPDFQPERKVYRICVNLSVSCSVTVTQMKNKGAAVLALIDKLQNDGGIVELTMAFAQEGWNGGPESYGQGECLVQLGTTPLDVDGISFILGHPAMYRQICFGAMERMMNDPGADYGSYACPSDISSKADYDVYIPASYTGHGEANFNTVEGAAKWVALKVEELAGKDEAA